jgi:hypothetical protein
MLTLRDDEAETTGGQWPSIHLLWLRPCGDNGPISKWGSFMTIEDIQVLLLLLLLLPEAEAITVNAWLGHQHHGHDVPRSRGR